MRPAYLTILLCLVLRPVFAGITVTSEQSECLGDAVDGPEGSVSVQVEGCAIRILHEDLLINCCLEYDVKVSVEGSTIVAREVDNGPPCDCECLYDVEATVAGLEQGRYTLVLHALRHRDPLTQEVKIPPCRGNWLLGSEVWALMGTRGVVVPVLGTNEESITGFSFGTTFPLEHARMVEVNVDGTVTAEAGDALLLVNMFNGSGDPATDGTGWATCSVTLDGSVLPVTHVIPAGAGQPLVNLVYDILPPAGSMPRSMSVPLVGGVGEPPVELLFTGPDRIPEVQHGIVQLSPPSTFIRGDSNGDNEVNISDPIALLEYLFQGGPPCRCEDAADANDDGHLDISDAIVTLSFLFLGGEIMPPLPPGPAGFDLTLDDLGCGGVF